MAEREYAVLCSKEYGGALHEMPPAVVAVIYRETGKSLIGMRVRRDGKEVDDHQLYDTRPSMKGWREDATVDRPGRFGRERLLGKFSTLDEAFAARDAAEKAWVDAEDRSAWDAARDVARKAQAQFDEQRKALEAEMKTRLADAKREVEATASTSRTERAATFARMREAALAVISSAPGSTPA